MLDRARRDAVRLALLYGHDSQWAVAARALVARLEKEAGL